MFGVVNLQNYRMRGSEYLQEVGGNLLMYCVL
jgi:hypothetical protein